MNKKLMAVAVAGALATPMAALAQTSTVQVYGLVNVEYGFVNQPDNAAGAGRKNVDALNSGASRLGFRGEEQLGGSLSAWFQCEQDFRFLGGNTQTSGDWCDRNSALGMKGAWGNAYIGTWDTPLKRVAAITRITNETGWLGSQIMTLSNDGAFGASFSLRNVHSVNYDTPNFGGFSASGQYTTRQAARNSPTNVVPTPDGRIYGISGQYIGGPLAVVVGYQKNDDDKTFSTLSGADDRMWLIGGTYTFGPVKVGLTYVDGRYDTSATADARRKSWHLAGEWNISGPHGLRGGYSHAGDVKFGGAGAAAASDNGADLWQIQYLYSFSKRTNAAIGYGRINNDSVGTYALTGNSVNGAAGGIRPGDDSGVFVLQLQHTF